MLENTHNRCGGVTLSVQYTEELADLAHRNGLQVHLDGARIFNAAASLGVSVDQLSGPVDSVTFCLSKGLCAPVGSVLCGSKDFIQKAKRIRKQLGGGMRQAGILAAAGIVALEKMTGRLTEDHFRARQLAVGMANTGGLILDDGSPHTNMIFANIADPIRSDAAQIAELFRAKGVLVGVTGERRFRFVTHYWVDDNAVQRTIQTWQEIYSNMK
jgi:threonine aldolase